MSIQFKTERQKSDWEQMPAHNPKLVNIANLLSVYLEHEFNKPLLLTDVFRTQAEFDALYAATPLEKRPPTSPHMRWEAFDFRSTIFTQTEKDKIKSFLNHFTVYGGQRPCCLIHTIAGNVEHAHVQSEKTKTI